MREIERFQFTMHAKSSVFQKRLERAKSIVDKALALNVQGYIAFSGGVDSTVVLDLVLKVQPHFPVYWIDDGADYEETLQFVEDTGIHYNTKIHYIRGVKAWGQWCCELGRPELIGSPMDDAWLNPLRSWDGHWLSDAQYAKMLHEKDMQLVFMGMMACESRSRSITLQKGYRPLYQRGEFHEWSCNPLASWLKQDVWAYIVSRNIPYNPIYDKLAELDLPLEQRRVGPLTCFRIMQYGTHGYILKSVASEMYNKLSAMFPKIREYS